MRRSRCSATQFHWRNANPWATAIAWQSSRPQRCPMTDAVSRSVVERFCKAYAVRDADKVAEFFDDNIEWTISGPVEYLNFCGTHRGKENVIDLIRRRIPDVIRTF